MPEAMLNQEEVISSAISSYRNWLDRSTHVPERVNELFRKRSPEEIKESVFTVGCSDNALVLSWELRKSGVQAYMAKAVLEKYLKGEVEKPDGHIFVYVPSQDAFIDPVTLNSYKEEELPMPGGPHKGERVLIRKGLVGALPNGAFEKFPPEIATPDGDIEDWRKFREEYQKSQFGPPNW